MSYGTESWYSSTDLFAIAGNMLEWCLPQDFNLDGVEFKSMASGSHRIASDFVWVLKMLVYNSYLDEIWASIVTLVFFPFACSHLQIFPEGLLLWLGMFCQFACGEWTGEGGTDEICGHPLPVLHHSLPSHDILGEAGQVSRQFLVCLFGFFLLHFCSTHLFHSTNPQHQVFFSFSTF